MKKWIQTVLRPMIGNFLRKFPGIYDSYQKHYFNVVEKKKLKGMHRLGYQYVRDINKTLDESKIDYFYTYGTMLGLVRDGGFIAHDNDIDMGIRVNDQFVWENLEKAMKKIGFHKKHAFMFDGKITEQTYIKNNVSVDFFLYEMKDDDTMITYFYFNGAGKENGEDLWYVGYYEHVPFSGMQKITCHDVEFRIPEHPEQYLEEIYGPDWKIPIPNWEGEYNMIDGVYGRIIRNYE